MTAKDDRWIVVSGAGGALGRGLVAHYGNQGRRVLALDRRFDTTPPKGITVRKLDLLVENDVRQAIAETLGAGDGISLLVNAVGQIWNEPLLAFRGTKLATHNVDAWRSVNDA